VVVLAAAVVRLVELVQGEEPPVRAVGRGLGLVVQRLDDERVVLAEYLELAC
jgi:hypothetical protein